MIDSRELKQVLWEAGAVREEPFVGASGRLMGIRVEWEVVDQNPELTAVVAGILALKIKVYKPDLLVAIPAGGNVLGVSVADELGLNCLRLEWEDRLENDRVEFDSSEDELAVSRAEAVGLVDDVYTTGGTLRKVAKNEVFAGRITVAGVGWDRSDSVLPKKLGFPLVSAVERYLG